MLGLADRWIYGSVSVPTGNQGGQVALGHGKGALLKENSLLQSLEAREITGCNFSPTRAVFGKSILTRLVLEDEPGRNLSGQRIVGVLQRFAFEFRQLALHHLSV